MSDDPTTRSSIVVLGATGFTGRLIARELAGDGADPLLTGRDPAKLRPLAEELGGLRSSVLDVTDADRLREVAASAGVVVNCAGPFTVLGEPVVRACVDAGAHYLDTTGEQGFMKATVDHFDGDARAAGVVVVNAMAFEFALGDFLASIAAENVAQPLDSLHLTYAVRTRPGASSPGTRRSILHVLAGPALAYEDGRWIAERTGARQREVTLARGRRRTAYNFPAGEVVTAPRRMQVREVRGWIVLGRTTAALLRTAGRKPALIGRARRVLEPLASRGASGPDQEARLTSTYLIRAEATGADRTLRQVTLEGRDPYGMTASLAALAALRLRDSPPEPGVRGPAEVLPPRAALETLRERGLDWQVDALG